MMEIVIIIKVEEPIDIKEDEIPVAVTLPPLNAEHEDHSSMLHSSIASPLTSQNLSTLQC
jgi:hypothetical protein